MKAVFMVGLIVANAFVYSLLAIETGKGSPDCFGVVKQAERWQESHPGASLPKNVVMPMLSCLGYE